MVQTHAKVYLVYSYVGNFVRHASRFYFFASSKNELPRGGGYMCLKFHSV